MDRKLQKLRELLRKKGGSAILIERQCNFSWLTGGRGFIGLASDMACGGILVTEAKAYVVTPNIEAQRLVTEECPGLIPLAYPWTREGDKGVLLAEYGGENILRDGQLTDEFYALRTTLTKEELATYRREGPKIAKALEDAIRQVKPGMTELALAGDISKRLWALGAEPITLLIAFDRRIEAYRHPLPTENPLKRHLLAAICARVHGLIISVTRCAHVGSLPQPLREKHKAVCAVDVALINGARPGVTLEALYNLAKKTYDEQGFAEEIALHHQGGLTGYVAREKKIAPGETQTVSLHQAYAFNPSITGAKAEDTIFIGEDGNEILTLTGEWPVLTVEGLSRPDILII